MILLSSKIESTKTTIKTTIKMSDLIIISIIGLIMVYLSLSSICNILEKILKTYEKNNRDIMFELEQIRRKIH